MQGVRGALISASIVLFAVAASAAPTTPATPSPVPIPYPNVPGAGTAKAPPPPACDRDAVAAAAARVSKALRALADAAKAAKLPRDASDAATKLYAASVGFACCQASISAQAVTAAAMGVATPMPGPAECSTTGGAGAATVMVYPGDPKAAMMCVDTPRALADASAAVARRADVPDAVKRAAKEVDDAARAYKDALGRCAPRTVQGPVKTPPPPPTGKPPGGACAAVADCQVGLLCRSGTCDRVGVPLGGACDAHQLCGPALECREGQCKLPCTCPLDCVVQSGNACTRTVEDGVERVKEGCSRVHGVCPPGCFTEGSSCLHWSLRNRSHTEACSLVCP
jgi:hypothetical protein